MCSPKQTMASPYTAHFLPRWQPRKPSPQEPPPLPLLQSSPRLRIPSPQSHRLGPAAAVRAAVSSIGCAHSMQLSEPLKPSGERPQREKHPPPPPQQRQHVLHTRHSASSASVAPLSKDPPSPLSLTASLAASASPLPSARPPNLLPSALSGTPYPPSPAAQEAAPVPCTTNSHQNAAQQNVSVLYRRLSHPLSPPSPMPPLPSPLKPLRSPPLVAHLPAVTAPAAAILVHGTATV